jgi:hypothetical protein
MVVGSKVGMLLLGILISYSMLQIVVMIKDYTHILVNTVCTILSVMVIALYGYEEFLLLSNFTGARKLFIILDYEFVAVTCLLVISYVSMLLTLAQQRIHKEKALLQCLFFIVILSYVLNCALGFFLFGRTGISH